MKADSQWRRINLVLNSVFLANIVLLKQMLSFERQVYLRFNVKQSIYFYSEMKKVH